MWNNVKKRKIVKRYGPTDEQTDRAGHRVAFTRLKSYWAILVSPKKLGSVKTRSRKSLRLALKYTVHPKNRYWRKTWQYPLHPIAVGNWLTVGNRLLRLGDRINELCFRHRVHLLQVHNQQERTNLKHIYFFFWPKWRCLLGDRYKSSANSW